MAKGGHRATLLSCVFGGVGWGKGYWHNRTVAVMNGTAPLTTVGSGSHIDQKEWNDKLPGTQ